MDTRLFEQYYQTYNSEDPEALAAFYHRDVLLTSAQGVINGIDAVLDTYRAMIAMFQDRMTPIAIDINGATGVVEIEDSFIAKQDIDDFMGMRVSKGQSFELRLRGTYTVEAGRFKHIVIDLL